MESTQDITVFAYLHTSNEAHATYYCPSPFGRLGVRSSGGQARVFLGDRIVIDRYQFPLGLAQ